MGIDKVAENKIAEWLRSRGDEDAGSAGKGRRLPPDRHGELSRTLGVHRDYVHSKILADNNIRPESVERRLELDAAWEGLRGEMRRFYADGGYESIDEFAASRATRDRFEGEVQRLDKMARKVNDAIISDSLRFNGRSPVRHARRFRFEERVREAIGNKDG